LGGENNFSNGSLTLRTKRLFLLRIAKEIIKLIKYMREFNYALSKTLERCKIVEKINDDDKINEDDRRESGFASLEIPENFV